MKKMKTKQFHKPFIKDLVFCGMVTIVSMISVRFILTNYLGHTISSLQNKPSKSYFQTESSVIKQNSR